MEHATCSESIETLFFILFGVLGVIILTGNIFACVVFLITAKLRGSNMNILLVSLATWDILMSVFVVPFYAVFCGLGCEKALKSYCWLMRGAKDCVKIGTTLNLYAITYDRYVAVLQPLRYKSKVTSTRVIGMLTVVWLLPLLLAGIRNSWQHSFDKPEVRFANKIYDSVIVLGLVVFLVVLMLITNIKIIRAIRKQAKRERRDLQNKSLTSQQRKGTTACVIVTLVFMVCWVPRTVYNFSFIVDPPGLASPLFFRICFLFLFIQSSLNPFIYWFYRTEFRKAAFSLLRWRLVTKRAESMTSTPRTQSFLAETAKVATVELMRFRKKSEELRMEPENFLTQHKIIQSFQNLDQTLKVNVALV